MPPYSSLRTFVKALSTGDTNITRAIAKLANKKGLREKYAEQLQKPGEFNAPMPGWVRQELIQAGLSQAEVDHIAAWPDEQKDVVRSQINAARDSDAPVHFSWELWDGDDAKSEIRRDSNSDVRVVFRSPRKGVKITSHIRVGEIHVDV